MPDTNSVGRVLVTGGSSGLGAAVADAVADAGGQPIVLDLVEPRTDYPFYCADLADSAVTEAMVGFIGESGLDAVVTCAAIDSCGPLEAVKTEDWERVIAVNLMGTASVIRAAMPALQKSKGRIVTVASTLGRRALPDATAYCASKFGVVGLSRGLNAELNGSPPVTCVMPGGMRTAFFDGRPAKYQPAPDAPLMEARDVADVIVDVLKRRRSALVPEIMITPGGETSWP
jgi:NAD(P)-dependent dehydrogenase (short-subunit alcohol dehydrogenase family)